MTTRIDLSEPITTICRELELERDLVQSLTLTPTGAVAVVFRTNEEGNKYVGHDGCAATETHTFHIRT